MDGMEVKVPEHLKVMVEGHNYFFVKDADELKAPDVWFPEVNMSMLTIMLRLAFLFQLLDVEDLASRLGLNPFDEVGSIVHKDYEVDSS